MLKMKISEQCRAQNEAYQNGADPAGKNHRHGVLVDVLGLYPVRHTVHHGCQRVCGREYDRAVCQHTQQAGQQTGTDAEGCSELDANGVHNDCTGVVAHEVGGDQDDRNSDGQQQDPRAGAAKNGRQGVQDLSLDAEIFAAEGRCNGHADD